MKIGVMSDLHLGHRQYGLFEREQDFYIQLQACVDEINKQDCDMVIIAGDIFDKPNPSPESIHQYLSSMKKLNTDIVLAIKGNHTMLLRDNHYAIDELVADELQDFYRLLQDDAWDSKSFASQFTKWQDCKIHVDGITYRGPSELNEFIELQKKMASDIDDIDSFNILVVHQSFKEFCGFIGEELSIHDMELSPYNVIICGHIHARFDTQLDQDTLFLQPGSIERLNTEEARNEQLKGKGIYIIDTETNKCEFHRVECQRKFFLGDFNVQDKEVDDFVDILQQQVDECVNKPIIALKFHDADIMWDAIKSLDNILLNNSKVIHEEFQIDSDIDIDNELPSVSEAVQTIAHKNLSKDEAQLCIELYEILNNPEKDAMELLNRFEENYYEDNIDDEIIIDEEIQELYDYFENLEVK